MYRIGIIGHGPEHFADVESTRRTVRDTIDLLRHHYGTDNDEKLIFNVAGNIGVGQWAAEKCLEDGDRYHLFLPFQPEIVAEHWYNEQQQALFEHYKYARGLSICSPKPPVSSEEYDIQCGYSYEDLADASNFIVAFWVGKKQGKVYNAIKYAQINSQKLVLDGLNELKLIFIKESSDGRGSST